MTEPELRPTPTPFPPGLADVPGFDFELGLRNMLGNPGRFNRMLGLFLTHHDKDAENLRQFLDQGQPEDARGIAHTLKGTAGTIGAVAISRIATEIDMGIRNAMPAAELHALSDDLKAHLEALVACLRAGLPK